MFKQKYFQLFRLITLFFKARALFIILIFYHFNIWFGNKSETEMFKEMLQSNLIK